MLHTDCVALEAASQQRNAVIGGIGAVNGLGHGIRHQELQAVRKALLDPKLRCMIDRVCDRRRVARKTRELRERDMESVGGIPVGMYRGCREAAQGICNVGSEWIVNEGCA